MRKFYWHQHGLNAFLVTLGCQAKVLSPHVLLSWRTGALLEGVSAIEDPASANGVLVLGPSSKVCLNLAKMATLNQCP